MAKQGNKLNLGKLKNGEACFVEQDDAELIVVKFNKQVYAYKNICPHMGVPLNAKNNDVLVTRGQYLVCSNHGAIFETITGKCIAGPCNGSCLQSVSFQE